MAAKILFSLPVHEMPEIVRDQIENINYFCPGSYICIHVSAGSVDLLDDFRRECNFENVFINPSSYETRWNEGLMHTHVSNFLHALERGAVFDKIVMISSNELLVKKGLADHVSRYVMGCHTQMYDMTADWGGFRTDVASDHRVRSFLNSVNLPCFFAGQAEGQFYSTRIFSRIVRLYISHFPMTPCGFNTEEVIPPTVAASLAASGIDFALPITLCDYCTSALITPELIDQVRQGRGSLYARKVPRSMRSPHVNLSVLDSVFSVKRIPRKDCELRRYVKSLMI
ncbi:hypothetical protein [Agrobacterium larrymoorei]|uniref:Uncharacterized protein n=1 Tax=Agrobacterium larrymoorei TaxID=160699 RepID=A0A4D7DU79_9HYPH|nr:hypothetical protein [Agrobacterium larrymoorei]QCI97969.1 hypothetical protein CFBP5473_08640 [Agrobacterium larrymoorei]QYA06579.1 hypothetical protein J5285_11060 [Agrobacterium larrymoorei]WHA40007.1 hypothetical protein CFBP5477_009120 [Agrobacterium larrymoorei]